MRTVILGGTGSIGLATARALAMRGANVTVISRNRPDDLPAGVRWRCADVADAVGLHRALADTKPDSAIHLASVLQFACDADPVRAVQVNVNGTANLLESCRALDIQRVVFGSSIAVYGHRDSTMRETDPLPASVGLYGVTKRLAEALGERYQAIYGIDFVSLRYSGVFGPGEARTAGMAKVRQTILRCALGEDVLVDDASGEERIHLTHVNDAAEATLRVLTSSYRSHSTYNVAGPLENYVSLHELHRIVCELIPSAGKVVWAGRARSLGPVDITRLQTDFGFAPTTSIREGLRLDFATRPVAATRGKLECSSAQPPSYNQRAN